jgi:hypothetical protein
MNEFYLLYRAEELKHLQSVSPFFTRSTLFVSVSSIDTRSVLQVFGG